MRSSPSATSFCLRAWKILRCERRYARQRAARRGGRSAGDPAGRNLPGCHLRSRRPQPGDSRRTGPAGPADRTRSRSGGDCRGRLDQGSALHPGACGVQRVRCGAGPAGCRAVGWNLAGYRRVVAATEYARTGHELSFRCAAGHAHGHDAGGDRRRVSGAGIAGRTGKGDQRLWRRTVCSCDCKGACCCSGRARYFKDRTACHARGASRPHAGTGSAPGDADFSGSTDSRQSGA